MSFAGLLGTLPSPADPAQCYAPQTAVTKGSLYAATKSLAIEYAKRGIRVNAVALGVIKTPMHPVETRAALDARHPIGHMGEIADVVDAILYLEAAGLCDG